jgi:DNA-binding ferritin-like protein
VPLGPTTAGGARRTIVVVRVSQPPPHDPTAALNQVLSEVIDVVQDVKQAHRKVPETHALHALLDDIFDDLRTWALILENQDEALGVSPLANMPTVAGRTPPNLWPGAATDDEVRRIIAEHLDRLQHHVAAARTVQVDDGSRAALAEVERGLVADQQRLREL